MTSQLRRLGRYSVNNVRSDFTIISYDDPSYTYEASSQILSELMLLLPDPMFESYVEDNYFEPSMDPIDDTTEAVYDESTIQEPDAPAFEVPELTSSPEQFDTEEPKYTSETVGYDDSCDCGGCDSGGMDE